MNLILDNCFLDITYATYVALALMASYGTTLFAWWWIKKGSASAVYAYITFMLLGISVATTIALRARHIWLSGAMLEYQEFLCSWLWRVRTSITFVAVSCIVIHMTYRAIFQPPIKYYNRRKDDK